MGNAITQAVVGDTVTKAVGLDGDSEGKGPGIDDAADMLKEAADSVVSPYSDYQQQRKMQQMREKHQNIKEKYKAKSTYGSSGSKDVDREKSSKVSADMRAKYGLPAKRGK